MIAASPPHSLTQILPPLILGGAGFSYQTHPDPRSVPVSDIIKQAFDSGVRAIDTSPFYEPSEKLLGAALSDPKITDYYTRSDYILMTKVGRISATVTDYSAAWVRQSVKNSLKTLRTSYLDVVFCHDIEFATEQETLEAVGALLEFVQEGKVRYIGLSSYFIHLLSSRAKLVLERYKRPVDAIQNWGQMTLQSSRLEMEGLKPFIAAGVSCVFNASPLAIGLLRAGGVPQGQQGDFHPAPAGLRKAAQRAADYVASQGEDLAALALRYAIWRSQMACHGDFRISTITGISSIAELTMNVDAARRMGVLPYTVSEEGENTVGYDQSQMQKDMPLYQSVQGILGNWLNYSLIDPESD